MKNLLLAKPFFLILRHFISFLVFILLVLNLNAQSSWTQKGNSPGFANLSFVIGTKGYIGSGRGPLWEYNPSTDIWTQKADFGGVYRDDATGFAIGNKIFIGTGMGDYEIFYSDFWQWDQATNLWSQKSNISNPKAYAMGFSIGNNGYIVCGIDAIVDTPELLEYDPTTDTWSNKATFPGGKRWEGVAFSSGSKAYVGTGTYSFYNRPLA